MNTSSFSTERPGERFDVVIVGGGLVGASLAVALREARVKVALVDSAPMAVGAAPAARASGWDSRIYAISPSSIAFLASIGVWPLVDAERIRRCERMVVRGDQGGTIEFSAYESGVEALAVMMESRELGRALAVQLRAATHVRLFAPAQCVGVERTGEAATLALASGERLSAALVVGADGAESWLREQLAIGTEVDDYGQLGVVANFTTARPHHGTAFQWFQGSLDAAEAGGILAYLPLAGDRMSMVWSTPRENAESLLAAAPERLCARVAAAGDGVLGALELITPARGFPLRRVLARETVGERAVLVGDAAHVVHPLAGQGVNLGFGDAEALAQVLRERESFRDCGDAALLRRYRRSRREAILAMGSMTHGLHRLFAQPGRLPAWLRNTGLDLTARLAPVKSLLARRALG